MTLMSVGERERGALLLSFVPPRSKGELSRTEERGKGSLLHIKTHRGKKRESSFIRKGGGVMLFFWWRRKGWGGGGWGGGALGGCCLPVRGGLPFRTLSRGLVICPVARKDKLRRKKKGGAGMSPAGQESGKGRISGERKKKMVRGKGTMTASLAPPHRKDGRARPIFIGMETA